MLVAELGSSQAGDATTTGRGRRWWLLNVLLRQLGDVNEILHVWVDLTQQDLQLLQQSQQALPLLLTGVAGQRNVPKAQGSLRRRVVTVGVVDVYLGERRPLAIPGLQWTDMVV